MANRFRLIVFLFLSALSLNSFALIPLVSTIKYKVENFGTWHDDRETACSFYFSNKYNGYMFGSTAVEWEYIGVVQHPSYASCSMRWRSSAVGWQPQNNYGFSAQQFSSCPSNSSPSGSQCICNQGYEEKDGNSCVLPEPPDSCEALAEKCEILNGSKKWITGLRRNVSYKPFKTCTPAGLVPGCNKGCVINSSGGGVFYKDQSGDYYFEGEGTISSETCFPMAEGNGEQPKEEDNPLPPSEPPEKPCKPGEYQGTVNGTKVCLPAKSKETIIKEETINNNDNSTTNINTTVKCENGKCTISETTTNKDSSGSTTGESNKETQVSQSDFCAQNPGSSVCKSPGLGKEEGEGEDDKKSSFSGSCSSSFNCEGDSVQCAIALEQHKTACKLFDESNTYFQAFKDAEASNSNGVESSTVDLASHVSVDSVIGAGACPADIEITVFNQAIPVELSKFCQYFDAMGMLIMLGACIGCLRILGSG